MYIHQQIFYSQPLIHDMVSHENEVMILLVVTAVIFCVDKQLHELADMDNYCSCSGRWCAYSPVHQS